MPIPNETAEGLRQQLAAAANADGGWAYYPRKASRIEPTCWATLCLLAGVASAGEAPAAGLRWLAGRQNRNGLLQDAAGESPNLAFNGLAALVAGTSGRLPAPGARLLFEAIGRTKGTVADPGRARQDNTLQGWSWIAGTFSWIEPTCWCLLALKKAPALLSEKDRAARIDEAERLLVDRVCQDGGWNYGNSNVLGQELAPYVPTTALGLLALQDRRDHPAVVRSLELLARKRTSEPGGMALALTSICLRIYDRPAGDVDEHLAALAERHAFFGNLHVTAMAAYALTGYEHGASAFRL